MIITNKHFGKIEKKHFRPTLQSVVCILYIYIYIYLFIMNIVHKLQTNMQSKNNEKDHEKKAEDATDQRAVRLHRARTVNHHLNITD